MEARGNADVMLTVFRAVERRDGEGFKALCHLAAIERGVPGVYNIVDDDPAPVSEWLPVLAAAVGAKAPRHIPAFLARVAIGEHGVVLMTQIRGASNAKAKRELGWGPRYPTWRTRFREALGLEGT